MKHLKSKPLSALFVTLTIFGFLLSSCDKEGQQSDVNQTETTVDQFSLNRASSTLCTTGLRLRADSSLQSLDFNNLVTTGQAKALTFLAGTDSCAFRFSSYDALTRTNYLTGVISDTPVGSTTPVQYPYTMQLVNSEPTACITNGGAWQIQSVNSTNTNRTQIILKGLTESQSATLLFETDKIAKVSSVAKGLGLTAYTCQ